MSRDSIIDEAAEKKEEPESTESASTDAEDEQEESRTRLTQRVPDDLLEDVERVQEKYRLPSRNAAINFMLTNAADDLLDEEQ
jgi:hypothetical protein